MVFNSVKICHALKDKYGNDTEEYDKALDDIQNHRYIGFEKYIRTSLFLNELYLPNFSLSFNEKWKLCTCKSSFAKSKEELKSIVEQAFKDAKDEDLLDLSQISGDNEIFYDKILAFNNTLMLNFNSFLFLHKSNVKNSIILANELGKIINISKKEITQILSDPKTMKEGIRKIQNDKIKLIQQVLSSNSENKNLLIIVNLMNLLCIVFWKLSQLL